MSGFDLHWMRPQAPYMPIATVGLLAALRDGGHSAQARWRGGTTLEIDTELSGGDLGNVLVELPWPSLDRLPTLVGPWKQGLKPSLRSAEQPARMFRELLAAAPSLEARLLRSIVTDAVLDGEGVPSRSRLLRGVKADLSSIARPPRRLDPRSLAGELRDGPDFRRGESGLGLGLVPEVQTFGGTTGPDASTVGAFSPLLYLLLWHGIMALPPVAVLRGRRRTVGGPLVTKPEILSWPRWDFPADLVTLRGLFSIPQIHEDQPPGTELAGRNIGAVYRSRAVPLSTMVAVFGWGERVA